MKVSQVMHCSFSSWYSKFKELTIKSIIIPLPQEFLDYLHTDGIVLPDGCVHGVGGKQSESDEEGEEQSEVDWGELSNTAEAKAPKFPEFDAQVKKAIQKLGGNVFPKLNWSAPRDATWISFDKTLKCTCPSDVYLLLKSSDFIAHDLSQPFLHCSDCAANNEIKYELVLRKWQDFQHGSEFRCFVKNNKLIAITQRHHIQYYEYIDKHSDEIESDIKAFFYHVLANRFPDHNYVFDVYRQSQGQLLLLDFNPFGVPTDPLLFKWEELENDSNSGVKDLEFRYIKSCFDLQPNPYAYYAMPKDFVDLAAGEDPYKLLDLLNLKVQQPGGDSNSDDG
ncbi:cell division cycle protein 123 homolog [Gigantopelta aegis]|uniref:cell division cycle protein 123 homolog n=1 Tax=Gigantopelta aegis TaxID=1735272 RepID=UPI001B888184|nr:cell division cycle protein 123 homolog [Gigantopelta aegis]